MMISSTHNSHKAMPRAITSPSEERSQTVFGMQMFRVPTERTLSGFTAPSEKYRAFLNAWFSSESGERAIPRAFTLVETLVAITILTLAMVGPFTTIQNSINAAYISRDSLIATSLAQEGVEYVRFVRDSNYLYNLQHPGLSRNWLGSFDNTDGSAANKADCITAACTVDVTTNMVSNTIAPLNLETTGTFAYMYNQQSVSTTNKPTRFTRTVQLTKIGAGVNEYKVQSTVTWQTQRQNYTTTYTEYLQDWQNSPTP